jgi:hypothetical protein
VAEFREVENPGSDMAEDMKRIRYLWFVGQNIKFDEKYPGIIVDI